MGHEHSTNAGLGQQSWHTMISLMELQLGKNREHQKFFLDIRN